MFKWAKRFWGGSNVTRFDIGDPSGPKFKSIGLSTAGVNVTEATAITIPAFFHAMRTFGQIIANCDFNVIKSIERGSEIARTHPVQFLLHDEPNEFQTAGSFIETIIGHAFWYGNGYAYIERNNANGSGKFDFRPTALLPLLPDRTFLRTENGQPYFETFVNGESKRLQPYDVFHVPGFSLNGKDGVPIVKIMKATLGLTKAQEEFYSAFFENGMNVGGHYMIPGTLSPQAQQNLKDSIIKSGEGLGNAFRRMFLEDGVKFEKNSVNPQEAEGVAARSYQLGDLARVVGLAPHLLYDLSRSTNNNIEHQGIEAVNYSFKPWARRLQQEANRKLLYVSEQHVFRCIIDMSPLTKGDSKTQAEVAKANFDMCALTPNERRIEIGLNTLPFPELDEPMLNTAYLPLSVAIKKALQSGTTTPQAIAEAVVAASAPDSPESSVEPQATATGELEPDGQPGPDTPSDLTEDLRAKLAPVVADVAARVVRRESNVFKRSREKHGENVNAWLESHCSESRETLNAMLSPICEALGVEASGFVEAFLAQTREDAVAGSFDAEARTKRLIDAIEGNEKE